MNSIPIQVYTLIQVYIFIQVYILIQVYMLIQVYLLIQVYINVYLLQSLYCRGIYPMHITLMGYVAPVKPCFTNNIKVSQIYLDA